MSQKVALEGGKFPVDPPQQSDRKWERVTVKKKLNSKYGSGGRGIGVEHNLLLLGEILI